MIGTTNVPRRARAWSALVALTGAIGLTGAVTACDDDDLTGPIGGVTAIRDESFDFTTLNTFAMPDTVIQFSPLTGTPLPVSRQFDNTVLDEVRQNLLLRGYTQVADPTTQRPDFVVLVGTTATTNYDAYLTYPWYDYWGYYDGWGWYAPGFTSAWNLVYPWYPQIGVTAYDRGTLVVTIVPTLSVNPLSKTVNASWAGIGTALLNGQLNDANVSAAVDQMFQLSPYLTNTP